jgi:hypothetical protein
MLFSTKSFQRALGNEHGSCRCAQLAEGNAIFASIETLYATAISDLYSGMNECYNFAAQPSNQSREIH